MKRYLRPLGMLAGAAARDAIAAGLALPLAGGPQAFSLVEIIERAGSKFERRIVSIHSIAPNPSAAKREREGPVAKQWGGEGAKDFWVQKSHAPLPSRFAGERLTAAVVMGIINATPDSFSDGGAYFDPKRAIAHAEAMIQAGACIVDVGGESTRPGALPVNAEEEIGRVLPVIAGIRATAAAAGAIVSIDTRNARTMQAALEAGAGMINDVSALTHDPGSLSVAAASDVPVVLMHMQGEPASMQQAPAYDDVALDVYDYLEARIAAAEAAGIARVRLIVDPGIGFGKTAAHNLALLNQLSLFHGLGVPLLVGVSRKGFIGRLSANEPAEHRLPGSLAAALVAVGQGTQILRVHDVPETLQALRVAAALDGVPAD
ncbi:MAG: folP [Rhodospirillales bacterium]|nr:folP [Rhodospirillales bacterium]